MDSDFESIRNLIYTRNITEKQFSNCFNKLINLLTNEQVDHLRVTRVYDCLSFLFTNCLDTGHFGQLKFSYIKNILHQLKSNQLSLLAENLVIKLIKQIIKRNISFQQLTSPTEFNCDQIILQLIQLISTQQISLNFERNSIEELKWIRVINSVLSFIDYLLRVKLINENIDKNLNYLLGFIKLYLFCGLYGYDISKQKFAPLIASPVNQNVPQVQSLGQQQQQQSYQSMNKLKKKNKRQSRRTRNTYDDDDVLLVSSSGGQITSDSEQSESSEMLEKIDPINLSLIIKHRYSNVRLLAYKCMRHLLMIANKLTFFGYWSSFIPDTPVTNANCSFNLLTSIVKDTNIDVRISSIYCLREILLAGGKFIYSLASELEAKTNRLQSYTSLSQNFASMLTQIHNTLSIVITNESDTKVLQQAMKCCSTLITITPYNKLKSGLLAQLLNLIHSLLSQREQSLHVSCLIFYADVFTLKVQPNDLLKWTSIEQGQRILSKLLNCCLEKLSSEHANITVEAVKLTSCLLISKLTHEIVPIKDILQLSQQLCNNEKVLTNSVAQLHVIKLLHSIAIYLKSNEDTQQQQSTSSPTLQQQQPVNELDIIDWWMKIFETNLLNAFKQQSNELIDASECELLDYIASIQSNIFEKFERKFQFHVITLILSRVQINDESKLICSSGIRCIGIYAEFNCLQEDINFLIDACFSCKEIIDYLCENCTEKDSFSLCNQVSWTLANINDILRKKYLNAIDDLSNQFIFTNYLITSKLFLIRLPSVLSDNVKTNCIRSSNCLAQILLVQSRYESGDKQTIEKYIFQMNEKFLSCFKLIKSYKLLWNLSFALSELFKHDLYIQLITNEQQQGERVIKQSNELIDSLMNLIEFTNNFKVQAHAVTALASLSKRDLFSLPIEKIIITLVNIVNQSHQQVPEILFQLWLNKFTSAINLFTSLLTMNEVNDLKNDVQLNKFFDLLTSVNMPIASFDEMKIHFDSLKI